MKKYTAPELEIMEFELEDVLTVSNGGSWEGGADNDKWVDA